MTFWEASDIAEECGYELWSDEFRKIRNMSEEEVRKYFSSPKEEKPVDPELEAFMEFNALMRQAKTLVRYKAEVGECSCDDLCGFYTTTKEAIKEVEAEYTAKINTICDEAEKYYKLAEAWARSCRTELEMVDEMRRRVAVNY